MTTKTREVETWEIQIPSTIWVYKRNQRTGEYDQVKIGGTGSKRVQLTADDREYYEESIPEENQHLNPFRNGSLVQIVDGKKVGLTEEDLLAYFEIRDEAAFAAEIRQIDNELTVRRLMALAETHGTVPQYRDLRDLVDERYKVGGTQRTVQEMIEAGERVGGIKLSG